MFTAPVGNFVKNSVTKRPTANTVTTVSTGAASNPENAYDGDISTYANIFASGTGECTVVYNTFPLFTVLGARLNIVISGVGDGGQIIVSLDGGINYLYNISYSVKIQGGMPVSAYQTVSLDIPNGAISTDINIKFVMTPGSLPLGGASSYLDVYDIYIEQ